MRNSRLDIIEFSGFDLIKSSLERPGTDTAAKSTPTPPPKDGNALKQVNLKLDDAVIFVIKYYGGRVYAADVYACKSPDPEEFVNKIFEMQARWNPKMTGVETTLFQRMQALMG